ncbi:MAG: InlB B-repeat-containing protein [Prevotellaceae bacterium]|jgi:uncharacterized repeat protein (TIGR02543 family)|nr:InlB B-repeat-containing protein [Prevotellaceae bacterium]
MVVFNSNGGSAVASQMVASGKVEQPAPAPTRSGYTFAGWYQDVALTKAWDFFTNDVITGNLTLYAKWRVAFRLEKDGKTKTVKGRKN